jgi:DNA-binding NtrC family response regulator
MKISLIEDEPDCYEPYQILLEDRGHEVKVFDEADKVISQLDFICKSDVIILDLMMQLGTEIKSVEAAETGTAIYKRIRKVSNNTPIVVLTAKLQSDVWKDFQDDKKVKYLGKPVSDLEVFYKTIEEWN